MVSTIFSSPFFVNGVLPFVLIFVLVYAILEKSKIFGADKHRINALVSLAIGLIFLSVGYAVDLVNQIVPILAVSLVAILIFLLIWGAVYAHDEPFKLDEKEIGRAHV